MSDLKNIYGISKKSSSECKCVINPSIETTLLKFVDLINIMKMSIEKYLPAIDLGVQIKGNISLKLKVPPFVMVRFLWKKYYPSYVQDKNNYFYRSTIRDFYFQIGKSADWANDPLSLL